MPQIDQPAERPSIGQRASEVTEQARQAASEQFNRMRQTASEYYEQGRQKASEWEGQLESYVREQPVKSLLIAAGVGMLLGMVWRRL
jgi:ElaB/YqjD/DUF883 family membrane-anchored ribosome-binding protein